MIYVPFSLRERDGLAEYLVYSPRFIYVFQQLKTSFLLCLIEGAVAWASLSSTALCISGSLKLVL
jgi:hypothetical protein